MCLYTVFKKMNCDTSKLCMCATWPTVMTKVTLGVARKDCNEMERDTTEHYIALKQKLIIN